MTLLDSHAWSDRQASATDLKLTLLFIIQLASTNDMAMIQLSFTSSKWNMGEIVGLKFHISYLYTPERFFWKPWNFKFLQRSVTRTDYLEKSNSGLFFLRNFPRWNRVPSHLPSLSLRKGDTLRPWKSFAKTICKFASKCDRCVQKFLEIDSNYSLRSIYIWFVY